jgi:type VI secretion system secreted protein VgrG
MEQQGNIMSDYYMICVRKTPDYAFNPDKDPELLRKVMAPFLAHPKDKGNLPR